MIIKELIDLLKAYDPNKLVYPQVMFGDGVVYYCPLHVGPVFGIDPQYSGAVITLSIARDSPEDKEMIQLNGENNG